MRIIKFRAWYDKSQTWVYFTVGQKMTKSGQDIYNEMCENNVRWYEFTGLLDKNGKEIYEGDNVKFFYNEERIETIIYAYYGFYLGYCMSLYQTQDGKYKTDIEVIGNIHEQ